MRRKLLVLALAAAAVGCASSTEAVRPPFGTVRGDCPAEDSCRADYANGTWTIVPVVDDTAADVDARRVEAGR